VSTSTERQPRFKREHLIWISAGVIIVVLGVALAVLLAKRNNSGDEAQLLGQSEVGGVVAAVGPLDGTEITAYLAERQTALQKASGERVAVVSLDHYATETEARAAAGQLQVVALLAAPPGGAPSLVAGDMAAWAQQQKDSAAQERDQTAELLRNGVDDPEYRTFYQQEVGRLNKVLAGIDPKGKVIFGLAVRGSATDLQAFAKHPGIRLVDVASSAKVGDRTEYRGIRPEQNVTVNQHDPRPF
jgi:flagellar basal body-associated protein FliL